MVLLRKVTTAVINWLAAFGALSLLPKMEQPLQSEAHIGEFDTSITAGFVQFLGKCQQSAIRLLLLR